MSNDNSTGRVRKSSPSPKAAFKTLKYIVLTGDIDALKAKIAKGSIDVSIVTEGGVDLKNLSKEKNAAGKQVTEEFEAEGGINWSAVLVDAPGGKKKEEKKSK